MYKMEYENMRMPELKSPFQRGIKYCHWQHFFGNILFTLGNC